MVDKDWFPELSEYEAQKAAEMIEENNRQFDAELTKVLGQTLVNISTNEIPKRQEHKAVQADISDPNEYLGIKELRETLNIGDTKARHLMRELPSVRIGRGYRVLRSDLDAYLKENGGAKVKWSKRRR